jgi:hypothetical protein
MMKKPTIPEFVEMKMELVGKHLSNYVETETGCWEYQGYCDPQGYGLINTTIGERSKKAYSYRTHRLSYYYHTRTDPTSLVVRHDCDNPCCINPAHLRSGTIKDNINDRIERGRSAKGEKNGRSKLTNECVINIKKKLRDGTETRALIARDFGISPVTIGDIHRGKSWGHAQLPSETLTKELQNPHQLPLFTT